MIMDTASPVHCFSSERSPSLRPLPEALVPGAAGGALLLFREKPFVEASKAGCPSSNPTSNCFSSERSPSLRLSVRHRDYFSGKYCFSSERSPSLRRDGAQPAAVVDVDCFSSERSPSLRRIPVPLDAALPPRIASLPREALR